MVSLGKIGLAFLYTPRFNNRQQTTIYKNEYNRSTPVNLKLPFFQTSESQTDENDKQLEEWENKGLDFINKVSPDWDFDKKLRKLDLNQKSLILKGLVSKWIYQESEITVDNLLSFKTIVKSLSLSLEKVYYTLRDILDNDTNESTATKACMLCDIYKPNSDENDHFIPNAKLQLEKNTNLNQLVMDLKRTIITKELEKNLNNKFKEYSESHRPNFKKLETNYELAKLRKNLSDECPNSADKITSFSKKKLIDHSVKFNELLWEIDFYEKYPETNIPEHVLESVGEDLEFGSKAVKDLLFSRIFTLQNNIKNILNPSEEVHLLDIPMYYLKKQYEHSLSRFNEWQEATHQKLNKLREYGFDLHRAHVNLKHIGEVGGDMPPINITPTCPEHPELILPNKFKEFDAYEKPNKEQKEQILKDLEKTRKKTMGIFIHMSTEQISDFFMKKIPGEVQIAKKAKERRMRIRELNNPFNTSEDAPPFEEIKEKEREELLKKGIEEQLFRENRDGTKEETQERLEDQEYNKEQELKDRKGEEQNKENKYKESKEREKEKEIEITPYLTREEVDEILSYINTEYHRHNMNLKHLEWQIKAAEVNPRRVFEDLLKSDQDIKNPEPKKLTFQGDEFDECFEWLSEYVDDPDSEVHRYRKKLFYSGSSSSNADSNSSSTDKTSTTSDKIKEPSRYLPEDPEATREDDPIIEDLLKAGASLNTVMKWPQMELPLNPTEHQMDTVFYRMSISQPSPIYRCTKCDYRIFSHPVTTYDNRRTIPAEYNEFKKDENYKCKNCGTDKSNFEETWTTGDAKYKLPDLVKKSIEKDDEEDYDD